MEKPCLSPISAFPQTSLQLLQKPPKLARERERARTIAKSLGTVPSDSAQMALQSRRAKAKMSAKRAKAKTDLHETSALKPRARGARDVEAMGKAKAIKALAAVALTPETSMTIRAAAHVLHHVGSDHMRTTIKDGGRRSGRCDSPGGS